MDGARAAGGRAVAVGRATRTADLMPLVYYRLAHPVESRGDTMDAPVAAEDAPAADSATRSRSVVEDAMVPITRMRGASPRAAR